MADSKISSLAAVTTVADTDEYVVARAGATNKITGANLKLAIPGSAAWLPSGSPQAAETYPRWATAGVVAPAAGVVYACRVSLQAGSYTTVTTGVGTQGVTLANTFFGLYETAGFTRVAVSADVSTTLAAIGAGSTGTVPLAYTVAAEADFYLAFVVGSASTMVSFAYGGEASQATKMFYLTPIIFCTHNATGQTSLPATLAESPSTATVRHFWFRYS